MGSQVRNERAAPPLRPRDFLGVDELLADEERDTRDAVRAYVRDRVAPRIADWFEGGRVTPDVACDLGALGVLGMHPNGLGRASAGATAYGLACLELEAGDTGVRSLVSAHRTLAMFAIHRWGSEEQKRRWLPRMAAGEAIGCFGLTERDAGSDPSSMRTAARRAGRDWVLHGRKTWVTNGSIAEVAVVWAATTEGVRGFLVPRGTRGFTTHDIRGRLSLRACVTSELVLDDVRLPSNALLPEATSPRAPLSCLDEAEYDVAWGAVGAARACFESALDFGMERQRFGRPIASFPIQQQKLAAMAMDVGRAAVLALHLGRAKDRGCLHPAQISLGRLANVTAALDVARAARQVLGADGMTLDHPVMRHLANLEAVATDDGGALAVAHELTRIRAF